MGLPDGAREAAGVILALGGCVASIVAVVRGFRSMSTPPEWPLRSLSREERGVMRRKVRRDDVEASDDLAELRRQASRFARQRATFWSPIAVAAVWVGLRVQDSAGGSWVGVLVLSLLLVRGALTLRDVRAGEAFLERHPEQGPSSMMDGPRYRARE